LGGGTTPLCNKKEIPSFDTFSGLGIRLSSNNSVTEVE